MARQSGLIIQRRLFRLEYGAYIAEESPDPKYGDGTGFRLITHDTSTGQFPDIAWLIESFPNARPVLRSNNRNVQGRMCRQGVGIAVLPRVVGNQIAGIRRLELPRRRRRETSGWDITETCDVFSVFVRSSRPSRII